MYYKVQVGHIVSCGAETTMRSRWNPVVVLLFTLKAGPEISSISFDLFEDLHRKKKLPESSLICQGKLLKTCKCISIHLQR